MPHLEVKWLESLRQYLNHVGGYIQLSDPRIQPPQRVHEAYIIDAVLRSGRFKKKEICRINYCRLYLQAITISDLTLACGTKLDPDILRGEPSHLSCRSRLEKFNQGYPDTTSWNLWRRANLLWADDSGVLHQRLGRWLHSASALRCLWHCYYSSSMDDYYVFDTVCTDNLHNLPSDSVPCPSYDALTTNRLVLSHHQAPISTFNSYLLSLSQWEALLLADHLLHHDPFTFAHILQDCVCKFASDGSVDDTEGTYGWVISTVNECNVLADGSGFVFGRFVSSFRAEGFGILAVLRFIIRICLYTQQPFPPIVLVCDSESSIRRVNRYTKQTYTITNWALESD